jgi:glycine oxidase
MTFEVVVVGGGVIGLSCAWRLAREGAQVLLLERYEPGYEASWAAAGLIAAQSELGRHAVTDGKTSSLALSESELALRDLSLHSRALYEDFASELKQWSGQDVGLSLNRPRPHDSIHPGILHFAKSETQFDCNHGIEAVSLVQAQHLAGLELDGLDLCCYWLAHEGQVDSRALSGALFKACLKAGVQVRSGTHVTSFDTAHGQITHVRTQSERISCQHVLWATGAWGGQVDGLPRECLPPVFPVPGQVISLRPTRLPRCIIYAGGAYLVPRRDGQLLVGATTDDGEFEKRVTEEGAAQLFSRAQSLIPQLQPEQIDGHWAGLRPATSDGLPIMGGSPIPNFSVATGHFRNGILLAPATAELITAHLLHGAVVPSPFQLARFYKKDFPVNEDR